GGIANNTTVTGGGLQRVNAGGSVSDTVISAGGGQSLQGQAVNTTLNGGKQWVHEGGIATGTVINEKGWQAVKSGAVATDTVVNTGAEGGPDAENGDNAGYVKFGHGSAQHVRAGFRLGSHNDMSFGEGTSSRDTLRDSTKHGVSELPVNWWVQPSVIRTFSSRGDMSMGTAAAGSNMTFSPSRNGTSLDLQAGLEARVRENITLGVQAGYA
ncbi:AIDA repeat-containing protein, partial [Escherichia coli]